MAEFCFECYKKYCDENAKIENLVMDKKPDLCEVCGEFKPTVIKEKGEFSFLDRIFRF